MPTMPEQEQEQEELNSVQRDKQIIQLWVKGKTHQEIGDHFGVSRTRITQILIRIRGEWKREHMEEYNFFMNRELARIDALEAEAWKAWEDSKRALKTIKYKTGEDRGAVTDLTELEFMGDSSDRLATAEGNHHFLKQVESCINMRIKVLGLTAKDKRETDKQTRNNQMVDEMVESLKAGNTSVDLIKSFFDKAVYEEVFLRAGLDKNGNG